MLVTPVKKVLDLSSVLSIWTCEARSLGDSWPAEALSLQDEHSIHSKLVSNDSY